MKPKWVEIINTNDIVEGKNPLKLMIVLAANKISCDIRDATKSIGRNMILFPMKYQDHVDFHMLDGYNWRLDDRETFLVYRTDMHKVKYFLQKKDGDIIGAGVKFANLLLVGEELVDESELIGEIFIQEDEIFSQKRLQKDI